MLPEALDLIWTDNLRRFAENDSYRSAAPFPHIVVDELFNPPALRRMLKEWPLNQEIDIEEHNDGTFVRKKRGTTWRTKFGPDTRRYLAALAGPTFLKVLEEATGIKGLIADPYLFGGGFHSTGVGGKLAVHVDYNKHPLLRLDRRLNLLVFLNENWEAENGGALELWERDMSKCAIQVLPEFGRTVLFSTFAQSFHGQPQPVVGPPGLERKSLALYYFSVGRPEEEEMAAQEHTTLWQERPQLGY